MQGILERVNGDVDYRATLARLLATPPMQAVDFHDAAEPERRGTIVNRIIRDTAMTRELKQRYQNRCQICLSAFHLENGVTYSEAHHIRPLGEPHNGPDTEDNILILCPNHHAQCDFCAIKLVLTSLDRLPDHIIDEAHIDYHNGRCR
jgi:predicted restriction endonuclease